jgi:GNAT superfamily N-acetyltransferase
VDLEDLECTVTVSRPLVGAPGSVIWTELPSGVAKVSADATLYTFDHDDEPERRVVACASAYTVDLDRVRDVVYAFDQVGGEAFEIAESILGDDDIFEWLDAREPLVGEQVSQLVIVEGVSVEEQYRGQRLGPRLLTTLVETVAGTGMETLIVLRAQPVPWEHLTEMELRRGRKKVAASYESVGFAHFRNNIYWRHNAFIGTENLEQ